MTTSQRELCHKALISFFAGRMSMGEMEKFIGKISLDKKKLLRKEKKIDTLAREVVFFILFCIMDIKIDGKHIHYYETVLKNTEDGKLGRQKTCAVCGHIKQWGLYKTDHFGYTYQEIIFDEGVLLLSK